MRKFCRVNWYSHSGHLEKSDIEKFPGKGHLTTENEELSRLRKENKRLRMEQEILKKAAAFFAKESM